ncbi:exonuclease subunit SbcD [Carboxylicivirga marina]|uniref:exonuclease subunit SbcD n=1 Tax=Carboxylicivirga marina TaxID=2800988 RepID=UPI0025986C04|nr:exonuclease subunit SbcD [uncultured Carboxylicivirga sp.]
MKILHTSDWHIGQRLHGNDREEEFQLFFHWLKDLIEEQQFDVLLISGDVFDVGFPSNSALKQYYQFLTSLIGSCCKQIIITGGNHDYISTLEAPSDVLSALNIQVIGGARENIEEELIEIKSNGQLQAVVAAVPFLRDKDIRLINAGESYEDSIKAINQGIIKHYQRLAEETKEYNCPVIAMGHLYVQGAGLSESERDIHIGNLAGLSVDAFPKEFDYLALGHIHRPQKLNAEGTVRYSGSPLPLSFSERADNKQIIALDLDRDGIKRIEEIKVPAFRKLISFKGLFDVVADELKAYQGKSDLTDWAEVAIEELVMNPALRTDFESLIESINRSDNGLLVVKPTLRFTGDEVSQEESLQNSLADLQVEDVFDNLLESKHILNKDEVSKSFTELLDAFHHQTENE